MDDESKHARLIVYLTFGIIFVLILLAGLLIFFERGGDADFDVLGQEFSSTNIGLAVLLLAILIFIYVMRDLYRPSHKRPSLMDQTAYNIIDHPSGQNAITWDEFMSGVEKLVVKLTSSDGFRPDLIIGICGGGLVFADIVSKRLGHVPCLAIWADRHQPNSEMKFQEDTNRYNQMNLERIIKANSVRRVLIVDDVVYGGGTLKAAIEFITAQSASIQSGKVQLKTAALFGLMSAEQRPDFVIISEASDRKAVPASDRLR